MIETCRRNGTSELQLRHRLPGQSPESTFLALVDSSRPRRCVEHAHRPERQTLWRFEERAGIEPEAPRSLDQWVVSEAAVLTQVRDNEHASLKDSIATDGNVQWQAVRADALFCLKPLPVGGYKVHDSDRCIEDVCSELSYIVEAALSPAVHDSILLERGQTGVLIPIR
jgi:hypothetical protein